MLALRYNVILFIYFLIIKLIDGMLLDSLMSYHHSVKYTITNPNVRNTGPAPIFYTDNNFVMKPREFTETPNTFINHFQTNDVLNDHQGAASNIPVSSRLPNIFSTGNVNFNNEHDNEIVRFNEPKQHSEGSFCRRSFDDRTGYCILANHCLHIIRDYRKHGIKIDVCTYRNNIPVICCPLENKHFEEQRISAKKCQEYHDAAKGLKIGLLSKFSGKFCVPSVPLIVGGKTTNTGEYPHMAAVGWIKKKNEINWICGGTLISEQFVLTAAHCVTFDTKPPDIVRLGVKNLNESSAERQDIQILIIILHPKYKSKLYYHDIALLKLRRRVTFTDFIRPACLWQSPGIKIPNAVVTGWGRTKFLGPRSNELRKVDLVVIKQRLCKTLYDKERRLPFGIIDGQFCAGHLAGGKDTCQGDSGGPLHAELPELNCVKFVFGVTSFGKFCAAPRAPGVYTKVYMYLDWIEKIVFKTY